MTNYVLQAEDVAIHYGGVKAVDGVALTLEKGQIRGLIGPNGAGKSTVIDAITVDLPAPLGPIRPRIWPCVSVSATPSTALTPP